MPLMHCAIYLIDYALMILQSFRTGLLLHCVIVSLYIIPRAVIARPQVNTVFMHNIGYFYLLYCT